MGSCEGIFSRYYDLDPSRSLLYLHRAWLSSAAVCCAWQRNRIASITRRQRQGKGGQVVKLKIVEVCPCGTRSLSLQVYTINIMNLFSQEWIGSGQLLHEANPEVSNLGNLGSIEYDLGAGLQFLNNCHPLPGKWSNLTTFFQMGCWFNHQLVMTWLPFQVMKCLHPYRTSGDSVRILASTWRGSIPENSYISLIIYLFQR